MLFNFARVMAGQDADSVLGVYRTLKKAAKPKHKGSHVDSLLKVEEERLRSKVAVVFRKAGRKAAKLARSILAKASQSQIQRILDDLDADGVSAEVVDAMTATLRRVYKDAHATAVAEVGIEASGAMLQHADELAIEYANTRAAELVTGISDTTREDLRSLIETGVGEGQSTADLADAIEESFTFSSARSEMIARTELAYAHVNGNLDGWKTSGVVELKRWVTALNCCDDCQELDGEEVPLDEDFSTIDGDIDGPPLHPNCRCDVTPVLLAEEEES